VSKPGLKSKRLKVERRPLKVQDEVIRLQGEGVPLVEIRDRLESESGVVVSDKSIRKFTLKYVEPKASRDTGRGLERSFADSLHLVNVLHGLHAEAAARLRSGDCDKDWFNALRILSSSVLECFKGLYVIQGQRTVEGSGGRDLAGEMDRVLSQDGGSG